MSKKWNRYKKAKIAYKFFDWNVKKLYILEFSAKKGPFSGPFSIYNHSGYSDSINLRQVSKGVSPSGETKSGAVPCSVLHDPSAFIG